MAKNWNWNQSWQAFSRVYLPTWWLHCSRHRWKCFIKMLINVVNFLTFAHISFGPIRGMPRWTHPHPSPVTYFPFICAPMKSWIGPLRSLLLTSFDARLLCHLALSESIRVFHFTPINKFIELINNCNTVADCSLNGRSGDVLRFCWHPLSFCISSAIGQSAL